jgi:hypothetical protein
MAVRPYKLDEKFYFFSKERETNSSLRFLHRLGRKNKSHQYNYHLESVVIDLIFFLKHETSHNDAYEHIPLQPNVSFIRFSQPRNYFLFCPGGCRHYSNG